jgi:uncharacterized surface protein with fasciclin (FAS1) repeats
MLVSSKNHYLQRGRNMKEINRTFNYVLKAAYLLITLIFLFSLASLAIAAPPSQEQSQQGILDVLAEQGQFTTLTEALETTNLGERLRGEGPFTIFAPTDQAFAQLPTETFEALFNNQQALTDLLLYHVVDGSMTTDQIGQIDQVESLTGRFLNVTTDTGTVTINGLQVITPNLQAANGIIHVIDTVMMPPVDQETVSGEASSGAAMEPSQAITQPATLGENGTTSQGQLSAGCAETYVVQQGDNLGSIAAGFLDTIDSYQDIVDATNTAAADDSQFSQIDDPNIIVVGQTLCIPGPAETTVAPETQPQQQTAPTDQMTPEEQSMLSVPEGKSKLIFENLSSVDLVVDLSGPTPDSLVIPPGAQQAFVLDPGQYGYNGHQPGGDFSFAPGQVQLEAGELLGLTCYDSGQCQTQEIQAILPSQQPASPAPEVSPETTPEATQQETGQEGVAPNQESSPQQDVEQDTGDEGATQDTDQSTDDQGADQNSEQDSGN